MRVGVHPSVCASWPMCPPLHLHRRHHFRAKVIKTPSSGTNALITNKLALLLAFVDGVFIAVTLFLFPVTFTVLHLLRDGRHLAYMEHGVPRDLARYKVVLIHGFRSSRCEASMASAEAAQDLGVYFVSFDRPGYGESDPDPQRSLRSVGFDIDKLADQLELGSKFYIIGTSMSGQMGWGCLKYISHRNMFTQQGEFESYHRDMMVGFGRCEFDPMDLEDPFANGEGSHLWHGDEDGLVPVTLQRYIADKLPWIRYHEISGLVICLFL